MKLTEADIVFPAENHAIFIRLMVMVLAWRVSSLATRPERMISDRAHTTLLNDLRFELRESDVMHALIIPVVLSFSRLTGPGRHFVRMFFAILLLSPTCTRFGCFAIWVFEWHDRLLDPFCYNT